MTTTAPPCSAAFQLNTWPLWVLLEQTTLISRGWETQRWQVSELSQQPLDAPQAVKLELQLYRDLRSAYRFNLSSIAPKVFIVCQETESGWVPHQITVCQDEAADYLDAGQPVLDIPMPAAIHAWMEAFMTYHGEAEDPKAARRRQRKQEQS